MIAPPPLLFAGTLVVGLMVDFLVFRARTGLAETWRIAASACALAAGAALLVAALGGFRRAGTPARPWKESTALVVAGVYAFTRNPMYLGMALVYGGVALLADSLIALLLLAPLLLVIQFGVIAREERFMEAKFGDAYRAYKKRVRPWL